MSPPAVSVTSCSRRSLPPAADGSRRALPPTALSLPLSTVPVAHRCRRSCRAPGHCPAGPAPPSVEGCQTPAPSASTSVRSTSLPLPTRRRGPRSRTRDVLIRALGLRARVLWAMVLPAVPLRARTLWAVMPRAAPLPAVLLRAVPLRAGRMPRASPQPGPTGWRSPSECCRPMPCGATSRRGATRGTRASRRRAMPTRGTPTGDAVDGSGDGPGRRGASSTVGLRCSHLLAATAPVGQRGPSTRIRL